MWRKRKTWLWTCGCLVMGLCCALGWVMFAPGGPIAISKDTTYLTQPISADGNIDYFAYVEEERARGVTDENNAAFLLLSVIDRAAFMGEDETEFARAEFGLPAPTQPLVDPGVDLQLREEVDKWLASQARLQFGDSEYNSMSLDFSLHEAAGVPWRRTQFPPLAQWVERNSAALDRLHDLQRCTAWCLPSPRAVAGEANFLADSSETYPLMSAACASLQTRAMLRLGEADVRGAWQDLRCVLHLLTIPGRLRSRSDVAWLRYGIEHEALALYYLVVHPGCDDALLQEIEACLDKLALPYDDAGTVLFSRCSTLQLATCAHQRWTFADDTHEYYSPFYEEELRELPFNGNQTLRRINMWFDRYESASGLKGFAQRAAAEQKIRAELRIPFNEQVRDDSWWIYVSPLERSRLLADLFVAEYLYDDHFFSDYDQGPETRLQLVRVALALQRYRLRHGEYPEQLEALKGSLDLAQTIDLNRAQLLSYERRADGFLLYSVGENQVDDGGNDLVLQIHQGRYLFREDWNFDWGEDWCLCAPPPEFELPLNKRDDRY